MLILYIKVNIYLNPANDQITIDCDNLAILDNWSIKIVNMLGQKVFSQPVCSQIKMNFFAQNLREVSANLVKNFDTVFF